MTFNQTSRSRRVRVRLRAERWQQLSDLAEYTDRTIPEQAAILLNWAISVMTNRMIRLYGGPAISGSGPGDPEGAGELPLVSIEGEILWPHEALPPDAATTRSGSRVPSVAPQDSEDRTL